MLWTIVNFHPLTSCWPVAWRDGSSPPLHSGELYEHWKKPLPGINEQKTASDLTAEELHYLVDEAAPRRPGSALNFTRDCLLRAMDLTTTQ